MIFFPIPRRAQFLNLFLFSPLSSALRTLPPPFPLDPSPNANIPGRNPYAIFFFLTPFFLKFNEVSVPGTARDVFFSISGKINASLVHFFFLSLTFCRFHLLPSPHYFSSTVPLRLPLVTHAVKVDCPMNFFFLTWSLRPQIAPFFFLLSFRNPHSPPFFFSVLNCQRSPKCEYRLNSPRTSPRIFGTISGVFLFPPSLAFLL